MPSRDDRRLTWEGCFNARDLGGLPCRDGRTTKRGAVLRADSLDDLTPTGWDAVLAHGVRTVIDLRNDDERVLRDRPSQLRTVHLPVDQIEDREFWDVWSNGWQFGTPLFYLPHLRRFPNRTARVIAAIARAEPGGVVFHCRAGRDRTGLVALLLLSLVDVEPATIADDYELSREGVRAQHVHLGTPDPSKEIDAFMSSRGTTTRAALLETIRELDWSAWMRDGGLADEDLAALRARLVGPT